MSQRLEVLRHLAKGKSLTPLIALRELGTLSLSQRVGELRREGWKIKSTLIRVGKSRVASYTMAKL
jgi:hypothetical protein